MEAVAKNHLDERFATQWTGTSRDFVESSSSLGIVFAAALGVVFLLLAAQFESVRAPLVILLTVPLALAGALAGLWFTDNSINLFSQIGLVMLVGLVTKNGILIVEFALQRQEQGLALRDAVREAAVARLRPILMTSFATILGIVPIALALGAGSESRVPMGIAVVWGMLGALPLTLVVVPAMAVLLLPRESRS
jgi:multidrug efflux pump